MSLDLPQRKSMFANGFAAILALAMLSCSETQGGTGPPTQPAVARVVITPDSTEVTSLGDTIAFSARALDASGSEVATTVTWSVSDTSLASIGLSGIAVARGVGVLAVTARADTASAKATFVIRQVTATLVIAPSNVSIQAPDSVVQYTATPKDSRGTLVDSAQIVWTTGDSTIATVATTGNNSAVVQVVAHGTTQVTATVGLVAATTDFTFILATLSIGTTALPNGVENTDYGTQTLSAAGGDGSYTWTLSVGSLPTGLGLNASTGEVTGTPGVIETQNFTVEVASGDGQTAQQALSITVTAPAVLQAGELCSDFYPLAVATFAETDLESAVRTALSVGAQDTLTCALISGLTTLATSGANITDLTGIQNLTGLTNLDLGGKTITDISLLSGLTNLDSLDLGDNAVTNISALDSLVNLTRLVLSGNTVADLTGLTGLTSLTNLEVARNTIIDLSPLSGLVNLDTLALNDNSITDVGPLSGLTNLTTLDLTDNTGLTDIQPLLNNTGLGGGDEVFLGGTGVSCTDVTALSAKGVAVTSSCVVMGPRTWTWISGGTTVDETGVYGTKGVANASNVPGAREIATSWIDASGNFWLFGGNGFNDLWRFDGTNWTWISGSSSNSAPSVYGTKGVSSAANVPGARDGLVSWADAAGNAWVFGGDGAGGGGSGGALNDLWLFDGTNWTWISGDSTANQAGVYGTQGVASGSNVPGGRERHVSWIDAADDLWMFGGRGFDATGSLSQLNDLWRFDGSNWTWISGSSSVSQAGVYGTQGTPNTSNVPGAREGAITWRDTGGNLWLFGGDGFDATGTKGSLNDLWRFDGTDWTWISGSSAVDQTGMYGTQGAAGASNVPGARDQSISWIDASDNLWLFGGFNSAGSQHNDLWRFDGTDWTWISGSSVVDQLGVYGTKGTASASNVPGSRERSVSWIDSAGALWLFGGGGLDSGTGNSKLNDLWRFRP